MTNSDTIARREKLMMLGLANLVAVGFMHASPSDFMRSLPPFAQAEGKAGFTLPEDLRVAYEAVKSSDPDEAAEDNLVVFALGGRIVNEVFGGRVAARTGISVLANMFAELADCTPLPNVNGVTQIKDWMKRAAEQLPFVDLGARDRILAICQGAGLFREKTRC